MTLRRSIRTSIVATAIAVGAAALPMPAVAAPMSAPAVMTASVHAVAAAERGDDVLVGSAVAGLDAWIDRTLVDGLVNATATATWNAGLELKKLQTGRLRQYVMFIVVGTVALFVLASMLFRAALAG